MEAGTRMNQLNRRRFVIVASTGAAGVAAAAFGQSVFGQEAVPTLAPMATPPVVEKKPAGGGGAGGGADLPTTIDIETVDLKFNPTEFSIAADTDVTVNLTNNGALPHDFTIDDPAVASGELAGGEATTFTLNLPEGEYEFYCSIPGHKEAGMVGTVTVVAGGGGGAAAAAPTTAEISAVDLKFEPAEFSVAADTDVTITLTNNGALPHDLHIEGPTPATSDEIAGGESTTFTVNLPAGDYEFWCTVPGHKEAGMVGTVTFVAGGAAAPAGGGEAGATSVELSTVDLKFEPADFTIAADTDVTINVTNNGALPHDFTMDDPAATSGEVAAGGTATVTLNLPAGTYDYYCSIPGHKEAGMVGTITVVAGGGAASPAAGGAPAGDAPTTVDVKTVDLKFEPAEFTVAAGVDVTVNLTNDGALPHDFTIDDPAVASEEIAGGASTTFTMNLPAGTYDFYCSIPGHKEAGMVGTVTAQ